VGAAFQPRRKRPSLLDSRAHRHAACCAKDSSGNSIVQCEQSPHVAGLLLPKLRVGVICGHWKLEFPRLRSQPGAWERAVFAPGYSLRTPCLVPCHGAAKLLAFAGPAGESLANRHALDYKSCRVGWRPRKRRKERAGDFGGQCNMVLDQLFISLRGHLKISERDRGEPATRNTQLSTRNTQLATRNS